MSNSIEEKRTRLAEYRNAERAILVTGQSYSINQGGEQRTVTRANIGILQSAMRKLEREIALQAHGRRRRGHTRQLGVILRDD